MVDILCADVHIIKALEDNYMYLVVDRDSLQAICVDPVEPQKILMKCKEVNATLKMCLTTHYHMDHSGGNCHLQKLVDNSIDFIGSSYEPTPCTTHAAKHGDKFYLGRLSIESFHVPCHTKGHMLYYVNNIQSARIPIMFTGDTIFVAGCGKFFEGTPKDMKNIIHMMKTYIKPETRLFVGHEYTMKNLLYAYSLEPENIYIQKKIAECEKQLKENLPTVPSILSEEFLYNPFFRCNERSLQSVLGVDNEETALKKCRALKDRF